MRLDFSGVKDFEAMPPGAYHVAITNVSLEDPKNPKPDQPVYQYYKWELTVQEGEFEGRKLWMNTSLNPKGLFKLKELMVACGDEVEAEEIEFDPTKYLGKELTVGVSSREWEGRLQNDVGKMVPYLEQTRQRRR
jgi:hypothetical protein